MLKDMHGTPLDIDDKIVYPFVRGSIGYLRIGIIVDIIEKQDKWNSDRWTTKMKVEWQDTESFYVSPGVWDTREKIWTSLVEFADRALKL